MSPNLSLSFILPILLAIMSVAGLLYGAVMFARRESTPGPQKTRQVARIALGPMIVGTAIILLMGQIRPDKQMMSILLSLPMIVITLRFGWLVLHEPTEADFAANFAHDREHCGKCGYSVTGNLTGRCSECGWIFPTGALRKEEPDWSAWWRKWRIDFVRGWRWHLSSYIGLGLYFFVLGAIFWSQDKRGSAVVISLLGVHFSINAVRVIAYLRRRRV